MMTGRVIQFGTSRFLQAHVDLFLHEARQAGQQVPPVCVVQSSGSSQRAGRIAAFGQPGGYPVIIRGIKDGAPVDQTITVTSIGQGLDASRDWAELVRIFTTEAAFVVSNTGDTGYDIDTAEQGPALLQRADAPPSFPGKLTALLWQRWQAGATPITILPCELLQHNGTILRDIVIGLAGAAKAPAAFLDWLGTGVIWAETLVDRIVSAPIDPIGAVAEPYALWAVQCQAGLVLPCTHPAIILADDLEPFERLKLHILNLGHTVLADLWQTSQGPADQTVRAMLAIPRYAASWTRSTGTRWCRGLPVTAWRKPPPATSPRPSNASAIPSWTIVWPISRRTMPSRSPGVSPPSWIGCGPARQPAPCRQRLR